MKTPFAFLLVGLLGLWIELPSTACIPKGKPGACPRDNTRCMHRFPDQCTVDASCKGQKKCCFNRCAKCCVLPMKEKPGSCPLDATMCPPGRRFLCHSDYECPGDKKCCSYECVVQCKDPRKV